MNAQAGNGTKKFNRDQIRAKIFSAKPKFEIMTLFGAEVEIRQPSLGQIIDAGEEADQKIAIVRLLIKYCYVPGTKEAVFEDADQDGLLNLPFGEDLGAVNDVIARLTDIDIKGAEKKSPEVQSGTTSM